MVRTGAIHHLVLFQAAVLRFVAKRGFATRSRLSQRGVSQLSFMNRVRCDIALIAQFVAEPRQQTQDRPQDAPGATFPFPGEIENLCRRQRAGRA